MKKINKKIKFENIFEYILYFKDLIEKERLTQVEFYKKEILKLSGKQREEKGRCILNLKAKYKGFGIGNTHLVLFEKNPKLKKKDLSFINFGIGDIVIVTDKQKPTFKEMQGVVKKVTKKSILIAYSKKPSQNIFQKENLRMDLFVNDITFQRMIDSLTILKNRPDLQKILLGKIKFPKQEDKSKIEINFNNKNLNKSQKDTVIYSHKDKFFSLIHGPFGCGKTTTLVEIILSQIKNNNKILVCADSNVAVDNIVEKLSKANFKNFVRVGNPTRLDERIYKFSLEKKIENEKLFSDLISLKEEIESLKNLQELNGVKPTNDLKRGLSDSQIRKYAKKRQSTRGVPAPLIRKMNTWIEFQKNIKQINEKLKIIEKELIFKILDKTKVIITTNVSSRNDILESYYLEKKFKFDLLILDEATQSTEPSALIPMVLAKKYIFAADHKQLPPTVLSENAKELEYSLFERLIDIYNSKNLHLLDTQYRMNEKLAKFPNEKFYLNKLKTDKKTKNISLNDLIPNYNLKLKKVIKNLNLNENFFNGLKNENFSTFFDISKLENNLEFKRENTTSYENELEAKIIKQILTVYKNLNFPLEKIGIITPYDNQVKLLKNKLEEFETIEVKSIDGFQGREKEIIIISFVRSNNKEKIGFLEDKRRLNVAITRQKRKLIMIGNYKTLSKNSLYKDLIKKYSNLFEF